MIVEAINVTWNLNVGFSSAGFFADNDGEFANIKSDELKSKLRLIVKFRPSYSPWSSGINEKNHASADITIKKLMEQHMTPCMDSLVKAAAWTHNTPVNKLVYSPLQLVTGQAVMIPGLTTGNVATESMTDSKAVQRTMENLMQITSEFRESDMRKNLKDCQDVRERDYQHYKDYLEDDKV